MPSNEADIRNAALEEAAKALEDAAPIEDTPERLVPFHDCMGELLGEFVEPAGRKWRLLSGKKAADIVRALKSAPAPVVDPKPFTFADPVRHAEWERHKAESRKGRVE
ncbi:hypothetical protein RJJ65_32365 [Rhizobium hidalgonense]|uniref:Uncharacterized protein n=1 Tax=Rhizobium hidalgonense TaxID=1538159 RepID=A0AAJ2LQX8_9HYPH|nr:hypothetical protein [Rhizobium hidalgonense]MDR9777254.1 hypothetical protein [Rhizobium hidalgonense]